MDIIAPLFDAYRIWYKQVPDITAARLYIKERLTNSESVIFIAFEDGHAAGFTQLYPIFSSISMKKAWLLNDLFVNEDHRKKGIAVLLLERAKQLGRETNSKFLLLETATDNAAARTVYEKNGWQQEEHVFYGFNL